MIRTLSIASLLFCSLLVGLVSAQEDEEASSPYVRTGPYFGAGGALILEDFSRDGEGNPFWTMEGRIGYRLHRLFAAQMEVAYYPDFGGYERSDPVENIKGDGFSITTTGKLYPEFFSGRVQPNFLVGVGLLSIDVVGKGWRNEVVGRFGGGFDIWLNERAILFTEVYLMSPGGSLSNHRYVPVQVGFVWRFD